MGDAVDICSLTWRGRLSADGDEVEGAGGDVAALSALDRLGIRRRPRAVVAA